MNARRRPSRRGVALILVLGFIALLSLIITALLETLRVRLIEGEARAQRASLRLDAESALAVMRARLAVFESDASGIYLNAEDLARVEQDPLAGWTPPDGATVSVKLRDASGLFSLNSTNTPTLRAVFEDLGVSAGRSASLADCLADWTYADDRARLNGAEADAYAVPGTPPNRYIRSFSELRAVKGFDELFFEADGAPNATGRELAGVSTFLGDNARPNVNTAGEPVLRLLAQRTGADPGALLAFRLPLDYPNDRTHQGVFKNAGDLTKVGAPEGLAERVSFASQRIRATITVSKGDLRYTLDAVLGPGGASSPVSVLVRADEGLFAEDAEAYSAGSDSGG